MHFGRGRASASSSIRHISLTVLLTDRDSSIRIAHLAPSRSDSRGRHLWDDMVESCLYRTVTMHRLTEESTCLTCGSYPGLWPSAQCRSQRRAGQPGVGPSAIVYWGPDLGDLTADELDEVGVRDSVRRPVTVGSMFPSGLSVPPGAR